MANMVIAPVLPTMTEHFSATPNVNVLISLSATSPALFVAILAIPAGMLGNRFGRERVLIWSALLYGIAGVAPYVLDDLRHIVATRAIVGIAEAAVMTCSTALIGDYFAGRRRERFLALQTGTSPVVAIVAVALGGMAGSRDWHNSFLVYGFAFCIFLAAATALRGNHGGPLPTAGEKIRAMGEPSANWLMVGWICLITVFAMTAFVVTIVQLPFLLTERGVPDPSRIGFLASCATLANPVGAIFFSFVAFRLMGKLALAFAMQAAGFATMALAPDWQVTILGALMANFGSGLILPLLITWAVAPLPTAQRGVGTGAWISASFFGQFLSPLAVLWLKGLTGSLSQAILVYAFACGSFAVGAFLAFLKRPSPVVQPGAVGA